MTLSFKLRTLPRSALQTTLFYVIAGSAWITVSDTIIDNIGASTPHLIHPGILKGLLFIGITAVTFYCLLSRLHRQISEQKKALLASEQRLMLALEAAGDGVWDWDLADNSIFYSPDLKQILGIFEHETAPSPEEWESRVHPEDREQRRELLRLHLAGETKAYNQAYRLLCRDGSYRWIQSRGRVVTRDNEGKPLRLVGTQRDVTTQKLAENEVIHLTRLYSLILDTIHTGVWVADRNDVIIYMNHAMETISQLIYRPTNSLIVE